MFGTTLNPDWKIGTIGEDDPTMPARSVKIEKTEIVVPQPKAVNDIREEKTAEKLPQKNIWDAIKYVNLTIAGIMLSMAAYQVNDIDNINTELLEIQNSQGPTMHLTTTTANILERHADILSVANTNALRDSGKMNNAVINTSRDTAKVMLASKNIEIAKFRSTQQIIRKGQESIQQKKSIRNKLTLGVLLTLLGAGVASVIGKSNIVGESEKKSPKRKSNERRIWERRKTKTPPLTLAPKETEFTTLAPPIAKIKFTPLAPEGIVETATGQEKSEENEIERHADKLEEMLWTIGAKQKDIKQAKKKFKGNIKNSLGNLSDKDEVTTFRNYLIHGLKINPQSEYKGKNIIDSFVDKLRLKIASEQSGEDLFQETANAA